MANTYPPKCVDTQKSIPAHEWDKARYTQAVGQAPFYGPVKRDYEFDHNPRGWPPGTEYQYAYCSNYRPILEQCQNKVPTIIRATVHDSEPSNSNPLFKLYDTTPMAIADERITGAFYKVDDQVGVIIPQDLTKVKDTTFGPVKMTRKDLQESPYTPMYRYKSWIQRPLDEVMGDLDSTSLTCQVPPPDTKHYDFYHQVRMHRPTKPIDTKFKFSQCRAFPIPIDKDFHSVPPARALPHTGKFNRDVICGENDGSHCQCSHQQPFQRLACPLTNPVF